MSLRNFAEPVTLVRSPTFTNSAVVVDVERLEARQAARAAAIGGARAAARPRTASRDRADVLGRGAAAAADDVHEARCGELAEDLRRLLRRLVVLAEGVRQAGVRIGADVAYRRRATSSSTYGRSCRAPSAQFRPTASGCAWRTEFQNASVVWPESVRPEASVIVPEMMTGSSTPRSSNTPATAKIAALAFSVSKTVSIEQQVDAASDQRTRALRSRSPTSSSKVTLRNAGIVHVRRQRGRAVRRAERAGDEARPRRSCARELVRHARARAAPREVELAARAPRCRSRPARPTSS